MIFGERWLKALLIALFTTSAFLLCSVIAAEGGGKKQVLKPSGLSKAEQAKGKDGPPPGWTHGEKKGWRGGALPPGLAKKGGLPPGLAKGPPSGWEKGKGVRKEGLEENLGQPNERLRAKPQKENAFSARI